MAPGADHDPEHSLETFQATFWAKQIAIAEDERPDIKHAPLPLARIKKVMKSDPDVKMISADGPLLFAKACEIFISELTARAYMIAEGHKRRTVTRADISQAAGQCDMFDFLIDILPPDERKGLSSTGTAKRSTSSSWQKSQENNLTSSDEHRLCMPAVDVPLRAPLESSSKQAMTSGASSDAMQEVEQIIDGTTNSTSIPQPSTTAEPSTSSPTASSGAAAHPNQRQESREEPKSPQRFTQMNELVSDAAAQRSQAILREAGSPETNVFYDQVLAGATRPISDSDVHLRTSPTSDSPPTTPTPPSSYVSFTHSTQPKRQKPTVEKTPYGNIRDVSDNVRPQS